MPSHASTDATPLTRGQIRALLAAMSRELSWGLCQVDRELRRWRALAQRIPDGPIREDALRSLRRKRGHADGAALFSVLPDRRNHDLLRLLVAYETILDFLDEVSERHAVEVNGRELHLALVDALEPDRPLSDYYRHHPWGDDGGYLETLVQTCRNGCRLLPSYDRLQERVVRQAQRAQVLALNHLRDPIARDDALRSWAEREFPDERRVTWFELGGAASASLVVHALLALAARPDVDEREIADTYAVYWPWVSLATAMLDSYADQCEDAASGEHSYVSHYPDAEAAATRIGECISNAAQGALTLPNGQTHAVIVSSMVAMYLTKDSVRTPEMRPTTQRLAAAGGSLARLLMPVLRLWRICYSQRSV